MRSTQHTLLQTIHMRLDEGAETAVRRLCRSQASCGYLKCNTLTGMTALLAALLTPGPCLHTLPGHWSRPGGI